MNLFYLVGAAFIGLGVISDKKGAENKKVDTDATIVPESKLETEEKPLDDNQSPNISESNQIEKAIANEQESDNIGGGN